MIDVLFNMQKIRFDRLTGLFHENRIEIPHGRVNVFINIEPILIRMCNSTIDEYLRIKNPEKIMEVISNVVNLLAHYRLYFSKIGVTSNIYTYIQYPFDSIQKNSVYNNEYRKYYSFKFHENINNYIICDIMDSVIVLCKEILNYIEGVHLITSQGIENSLVPYIISHEEDSKDCANFILSDDIYDFQYALYGFNILYSRQDKSQIIRENNVLNTIGKILKVNMDDINPKQLPFILSVIGSKYRNIYGIKGVGARRCLNMIRHAIKNDLITYSTDNINLLTEVLKKDYVDAIKRNYYCTNLEYQYSEMSRKDIYDITSQCINKYDNPSLKKLNDEYFDIYPLMLPEITSKPFNRTIVEF